MNKITVDAFYDELKKIAMDPNQRLPINSLNGSPGFTQATGSFAKMNPAQQDSALSAARPPANNFLSQAVKFPTQQQAQNTRNRLNMR